MNWVEKKRERAKRIKAQIERLEGQELGHGFIYRNGEVEIATDQEDTYYLVDQEGQPVVFYHYRNLDLCHHPDKLGFHDLMHFGDLPAAYSRGFTERLYKKGLWVDEKNYAASEFNQCADMSVLGTNEFGDEVLFAANIRTQNPCFIPDAGQTNFFESREVLYACGYFTKEEIDRDFFDYRNCPVPGLTNKVVSRLKSKGYDSVIYLNAVENPGSLSVIVFEQDQITPVDIPLERSGSFSYGQKMPEDPDMLVFEEGQSLRLEKKPDTIRL